MTKDISLQLTKAREALGGPLTASPSEYSRFIGGLRRSALDPDIPAAQRAEAKRLADSLGSRVLNHLRREFGFAADGRK